MKQILVWVALLLSVRALAQSTSSGKRYFGMHFDFHADPTDSLIGRNLSERSLDSLLSAVRPDFIQIDCKGHPGVASYPSKVPNATVAASFVGDPLRFYRTVTRKHGVDLYLHYSGIFDKAILEKHPNWGVVKANGELDRSNTSVHGPYVDSLLIPQLNELADYGADGVWVDGECWATVPDYSPTALARFRTETGMLTVPHSEQDPSYASFTEFARRSFIRYLGHYTDEVHRYRPAFKIASNWAYSSMMPEPVTTGVDYLSGDLTPGNSVNSAALEARILAPQGQLYNKPWDLMSWSFWYQFNPTLGGDQKTAVHLMQDAAETIAVGGGFQGYFHQKHDGSIPLDELSTMTALSRFVRARQPFCAGARPVPQVALLYANATVRKYNKALFSRDQIYRIEGVLTALLDAQVPTEVLSEHHLRGRMSQYPLIVVSQQDSLDPAFRAELLNYARQGGNLLLIGAETTRGFAAELGVEPIRTQTAAARQIRYAGAPAVVTGSVLSVRAAQPTQVLARLSGLYAGGSDAGIAATLMPYNRGKLVGVYADLSRDYQKHQSPKLRDFVASLVEPLLPNPMVRVRGSHLVHVVMNRLGSQLAVNLINTGGRHADVQVFTYDEVPPLTNLTVTIRTSRPPRRIVQQPENKALPVRYAGGLATVTVPQLTLHSILMVE